MRRPFLAHLVAAMVVGTAAPAAAQPPAPVVAGPAAAAAPPRVMTLPDAIAYARAHQPAIRAALARVQAEEQAARIPRAQWLPSVGATVQLFAATANNSSASYVGTPLMDIPRIGGTTVTSAGTARPYPSTFAGAGLQQEVFDFGRIAAQAAAADAVVDVARQQAAAERVDIDFGVEEAFFAVHASKAVLRAADGALERARVHRELAKAGVDAGLRPPVELARAEADLARFQVGRQRAQAGVVVAESVLAAAVGVPEVTLDIPPEAPAPRDMPSLSEAVREAAERDPHILEAQARVRAQELTAKAIGAELRPNLELTSTLSVRAGGAPPSGSSPEPARFGGWVPDIPNWDVGAVLTWPIWSGPTAARERAARARVEVEREDLALVRYQRGVAVQQAYIAVTVARAALPALERSVEAARANYEQADARFKAGVGNSVELADAEALRTQAEIDLVIGRFELARARVAFGRAIAEEP